MDNNKILNSISYLDFINKINSLTNDILYSQTGYYFLKSIEAIKSKEAVIEKFYFEANKIKNSLNFSDESNYIELKARDFIMLVEKHYNSELLNWSQDVFEELSQNYLFEISVEKNKAKDIYSSLMNLILWFSKIKKFSKAEFSQIKVKYEKLFKDALNSTDLDYISQIKKVQTSCKDYLFLWNLILGNTEEFLKCELNSQEYSLSFEDIKYFESIKNKLNSYKKETVLDEFLLINSAFKFFKIKDDNEKYELIKKINNDFILHLEKNKTISEEEKINLIKRRISLFKDMKNKVSQYFITQFSCSLNE